MGEAAEMLLDGTMCESCGEYLGDAVGYSRSCCDESHPNYLGIDDIEPVDVTFDDVEKSGKFILSEIVALKESNPKLTKIQQTFIDETEKILLEFFASEVLDN